MRKRRTRRRYLALKFISLTKMSFYGIITTLRAGVASLLSAASTFSFFPDVSVERFGDLYERPVVPQDATANLQNYWNATGNYLWKALDNVQTEKQ